MLKYIAAAVAALSLSAAAPAMAEPETQTIAATCTPYLNNEAGAPEACQVLVMSEDGIIAVAFVIQTSGTAIYLGVPEGDGVTVGAISVDDGVGAPSEPVQATGRCATQGNVIACTATVGTNTLMVKAEA